MSAWSSPLKSPVTAARLPAGAKKLRIDESSALGLKQVQLLGAAVDDYQILRAGPAESANHHIGRRIEGVDLPCAVEEAQAVSGSVSAAGGEVPLAGLLGGATGLTEAWLLDQGNREALVAFLRRCGGFRALPLH
jgi:hypothetical protein